MRFLLLMHTWHTFHYFFSLCLKNQRRKSHFLCIMTQRNVSQIRQILYLIQLIMLKKVQNSRFFDCYKCYPFQAKRRGSLEICIGFAAKWHDVTRPTPLSPHSPPTPVELEVYIPHTPHRGLQSYSPDFDILSKSKDI